MQGLFMTRRMPNRGAIFPDRLIPVCPGTRYVERRRGNKFWGGAMRKIGYSFVAACCLCLNASHPARAADPAAPDLKAEIDATIHRFEGAFQGMVKWNGAEKIDVRQDGNASVAEIRNAKISVQPPPEKAAGPNKAQPATPPQPVQIVLDKIELRRVPAPSSGLDYTVTGPTAAVLTVDDKELKFTFKDQTSHFVLDAGSQHLREGTGSLGSARLEDKTGFWMTFGPANSSFKIEAAPDGSWKAPLQVELTKMEFFAPKGPAGGTIDRIARTGGASGPDLAAYYRMRDRLAAIQQSDRPPQQQAEAILKMLPEMFAAYGTGEGVMSLEGLAVRAASVPLVTLGKAQFTMNFTGLTNDTASLRLAYRHDGLKLDASVPNAEKVPTRTVVDLGLEDLSSAPLRSIIEIASKMRDLGPDGEQKAVQQIMGIAAGLTPALRLHELSVDTPDVGVEAKAEAKGSPLSPKGYTAEGDVLVRGLDAAPRLVAQPEFANYVALLSELGKPGTANGKPVTEFHLTSAPPKWIEINGHDVSGWLTANPQNGPRRLRLAEPPLTGDDVRAVQRALAARKVAGAPAQPSGSYDGATAAAVARFQRQAGLNVDGTVDAATRDKLGVSASAGPGQSGGSPNAGAPKVQPAHPGAPRAQPARPGAN